MSRVDLSVVIPTYRGAPCLAELVSRLVVTLEGLVDSHEIIVVNDASPDDTWAVLSRLTAEHPTLRAIDLLHNHGQHVATLCGMSVAHGNLVATMDDDLQHRPEDLPMLVRALEEYPEWDAVVGDWPRDQGFIRELGSKVHAWTDRIAHGTPRGFRYTAFRLMRRPVVDAMLAHESRSPVIGPLLTRSTNRVHNVPVNHDERFAGNSGFRFRHGVSAVLTNFTSGSTLPLKLMSGLGFVIAALAFLYGAVVLGRYLFAGTSAPPGWLSVFLATLFFGGALMVQVGLLGQYVHVIVREVRRPPRWDVRRSLGFPAESPAPLADREQA